MKAIRTLTVAVCVGATALLMGAFGCNGTVLHEAALSAGTIAASLHTAATANHDNTLETDDERKVVANYIVQAAAANDEFIGVISKAQANGNKLDATAAASAFGNLVDRVDQMYSLGVLHIKDPAAQAKFALIVGSIRDELAVIQALVAQPTSKNERPGRHPYSPFMALTFTATEIEELVALAIAARSALVPKLQGLLGKSDAEILSDASADDAAAIAQAVADGADAPK